MTAGNGQGPTRWIDLVARAVEKLGLPALILGAVMYFHWYQAKQWREDSLAMMARYEKAVQLCIAQSRLEHQETRRELKAETEKVVQTVTQQPEPEPPKRR